MSTLELQTVTNADTVKLSCTNAALTAIVTINGVATNVAGDITAIACAAPINRHCNFISTLENFPAAFPSQDAVVTCNIDDCTNTACTCTLPHGQTTRLSVGQCRTEPEFCVTSNNAPTRRDNPTQGALSCANGVLSLINGDTGVVVASPVEVIDCPSVDEAGNVSCP